MTFAEATKVPSLPGRRNTLTHIPCLGRNINHHMIVTDLRPARNKYARRGSSIIEHAPTVRNIQALAKRAVAAKIAEEPEQSWKPIAGLNMLLNVLSVIPYVKIIAMDSTSPLFISFCTHIFVVLVNLHKAPSLLMEHKLPVKYHVGFVVLAFIFNFLKSDAFGRLPSAVAMVLMNLQMLVGMVVQAVGFRQHFSLAQVSGCAVVTVGVAFAGLASARGGGASTSGVGAGDDFVFGCLELVLGLVALVLLSALVKHAFANHGEAVDEQIFFQHLFGIPLFFMGSQWSRIGPKLGEWTARGEWILPVFLLLNLSLTFAGAKARITFAGRAPNALLVQLVETLTKFVSLLATALINAPPLPPAGFWGGSCVLVLGTLQFLTASDAPENQEEEKKGR